MQQISKVFDELTNAIYEKHKANKKPTVPITPELAKLRFANFYLFSPK